MNSNFEPNGEVCETRNSLSSVISSGGSDVAEGKGLKDVAQLAYAIGKATVGTKKSKQKARNDFIKGAKSSIK